MTDKIEEKKEHRQLLETRFSLAEHKRNVWFVVPEDGTTPDETLEAAYWSHAAPKMRPCDEVIIHSENGAWRLHLHVLATGRNWAKVTVLSKHDFGVVEAQAVSSPDFEIKWRGPNGKYAVIRKSDGVVIKDKFDSDPAASAYLADYRKTIGA